MSTLETERRLSYEVLSRNRHCRDRESLGHSHGEEEREVEKVERLGSTVRLRRGGDTAADAHPGAENIEGTRQQSDSVSR